MKLIFAMLCTCAAAAEPVITAPPAVVGEAVQQMVQNKAVYARVATATGLRWEQVASIHYREASCNFGRSIQDGRRLPANTNWEAHAIAFLTKWMVCAKRSGKTDPLVFAEAYNGFGYRKYGIATPYVWAGTNRYTAGKFVRDGKFDAKAVDAQLGIYVLLKALEEQACESGCTKQGSDEDQDVEQVPLVPGKTHPESISGVKI